jgi:hypothetical protein
MDRGREESRFHVHLRDKTPVFARFVLCPAWRLPSSPPLDSRLGASAGANTSTRFSSSLAAFLLGASSLFLSESDQCVFCRSLLLRILLIQPIEMSLYWPGICGYHCSGPRPPRSPRVLGHKTLASNLGQTSPFPLLWLRHGSLLLDMGCR